MKNSFYHAFQIGFNWVFIVAPAMLLIALVFNAITTKIVSDKRSAHKRACLVAKCRQEKRPRYTGRKFEDMVANIKITYFFVSVAVFAVMLWVEARSGILQTIDNMMDATSDPTGFYALLLSGIAIGIIVIVYGAIMLSCLIPRSRRKNFKKKLKSAPQSKEAVS